MGTSRFTVSLRIRHPSMDPGEITATLGRQPRRCWKHGAPRTDPRGRPLDGTYRHSFWTGRVCEGSMPPGDLPTAIDRVLDELTQHRDFLRRIRAEGGKCEFFIGWFMGSAAGAEFLHSTLAKMAALGIDMSFDNYHDPSIPEDEEE